MKSVTVTFNFDEEIESMAVDGPLNRIGIPAPEEVDVRLRSDLNEFLFYISRYGVISHDSDSVYREYSVKLRNFIVDTLQPILDAMYAADEAEVPFRD